ncbi:hypothetical protein [Streptomyces sp. NRRL S-448]|uniref:hypothetical protein n=1 Tax=Streptomyces sp. NRRL S-448 TaxID=1463907 RepID=UPI000A7AD80F
MSHSTHTPVTVLSKRRASRYAIAFACASVISGAIALPASAAALPSTPPARHHEHPSRRRQSRAYRGH